jgi:hypothetical protein
VQSALSGLYDLELAVRVDDFVCDEGLARTLGGDDAIRRREVLFVVEDGEDVHVGLYLAKEALDAVADPAAWHTRFDAMCLVAEGVSHFVLLHFRSEHEAPVREIELELQAEVDKYALGLLAGQGVGLLRESLRERSAQLRRRLFDDAELLDPPGSERAERYRTATRLAHAYTARLERAYVERGDLEGLRTELRRFYRLGLEGKLERCARSR